MSCTEKAVVGPAVDTEPQLRVTNHSWHFPQRTLNQMSRGALSPNDGL